MWPVAVHAETVQPGGAPADLKLTGTVLVWKDAVLRLESAKDSPTLRFAKTSERRTGDVIPAKVIGTTESLVEVELATDRECVQHAAYGREVGGIRVFVQRSDLAPVVIKAYAETHKDGSRISVAAGEPVMPTTTSAFQVASAVGIEVDIPAASVGYAYTSAKRTHVVSHVHGKPTVSINGTVKLGTRTTSLGYVAAASVKRRKKDAVISVASTCVKAAVVAPLGAIKSAGQIRYREPGQAAQVHREPPTVHWIFPKGTALTTPAGRAVATATRDIDVLLSTSADDTKQVCRTFNLTLWGGDGNEPWVNDTDPAIDLCVPTGKTKQP
jgi:hypothetical protein